MDPKGKQIPREPNIAYRDDSFDAEDARLLDSQDENSKPLIKVTVSVVNTLRVITVPLTLAAFPFVVQYQKRRHGGAVVFVILTGIVLGWNIYQILDHWGIFPKSQKGSYSAKLFGFTCTVERDGVNAMTFPRTRGHTASAIDFGFSLGLMIVVIRAYSSSTWWYSDHEPAVRGLYITLT